MVDAFLLDSGAIAEPTDQRILGETTEDPTGAASDERSIKPTLDPTMYSADSSSVFKTVSGISIFDSST